MGKGKGNIVRAILRNFVFVNFDRILIDFLCFAIYYGEEEKRRGG